MLKYSFILILIILQITLTAQVQSTYGMRGIVTDNVTQSPIIGALVYITGFETSGVATDENGEFTVDNLNIGRHTINVTYLGYINFSNSIEIKSGKELIMNIALEEDVQSLSEIVVSAQSEKSRPINSMSYASTRTFSVEESNKFAAAVDDPARMALSYAGVVSTDDGNNTIAIRGNSPTGLLWRLEGVDIPNPNHYAQPASSGGGVSVLSSQMLSNSDFSTGAFASEYGNALSGVFDLKFRNGNNKNTEFTLKAGVLGLEAAVEGPFSKNYNGSYLINYRYSTLTILDKMGIDLMGELNFQDLNYHINLPTKKLGTFALFGLHGWSSQRGNETLDTTEMDAIFHKNDYEFISNMSVDGLKHFITPWKNGFLKTTFAMTKSKNLITQDQKTIYNTSTFFEKYNSLTNNDKLTFTTVYTHKLAPQLSIRTGIMNDVFSYDIRDDLYTTEQGPAIELIQSNGTASLLQFYSQMQLSFNNNWKSNIGIHYTNFLLNDTKLFEPRLNISYSSNGKNEISFAYGLHSQINALPIYFLKNETGLFNKNLGLNKAHHFVLSHQYDINTFSRIKTEIYHQELFDVPVGADVIDQNYSIINQLFKYPTIALENKGRGRNTGIETTFERFMHNNLYYIFTASLSDSKYKTPTSKWIDTRYNTKYSIIGTIGKEWAKGKQKQNVFGINIKTLLVGGQRYTPIDLEASIAQEKEVLDETKAFTLKLKDYWRLDLGIKYKRNHNKWTSTLSLDIQNATSRKNVGGIEFNQEKVSIEEWYQTPLLPILSYKVEF